MALSSEEPLTKYFDADQNAPAEDDELYLERITREKLEDILSRAGIDAWEHPEFARALEAPEGKQNTWDTIRRRREIVASVPQILPVHGRISSIFGVRHVGPGESGVHKGIDVAAPLGSIVYAPADGVVRFAGRYGGFGKYVSIVHGYGLVTKFGHNSELLVKAGQRVRRGDPIAKVGESGRSRGIHLHYEVWLNDKPIDPMPFLPEEVQSGALAMAAESIPARYFDP